jgi:hypothetical protein
MENPVEKLTQKIAWHETEARRLRTALEVFEEMESDGDEETPNFSDMTFLDALRVILKGGAKKTTSQIEKALRAGKYKSETKKFRLMVANRLADATRRNQAVKHGKGRGVTWSLAPSLKPAA